MKVLSPKQMYHLDTKTMEEFGIPSRVLMENAGKGCADYINKELLASANSEISVFCGSGNNGGDGSVIARWLSEYNHIVTVFLLGNENKFSSETRANYDLLLKLNIPIIVIEDVEAWKAQRLPFIKSQIVIDAIFGIGFRGKIEGYYSSIIKSINNSKKLIISIDIPSGLDVETGMSELCVKADHTLTLAALKYGHLIGRGREYCGKTTVIPIGIPAHYFAEVGISEHIDSECHKLPERSKFSHKGDYGRVAIIAGSKGFTGAAVMASKAALRSGAGLITLFHPKSLSNIFEIQLTEVMTSEIQEIEGKPDTADLLNRLEKYDIVLLGPGIGVSEYSKAILEEILVKYQGKLVIDADGLNILSNNRHLLNQLAYRDILLTPHIGEFSRLCEKSITAIQADTIKALKEFIGKYRTKVLLKSSTTIYADESALQFSTAGNDGLSTGGSGDVLAGIIASFIGQGLLTRDASISASYLLGKTAEKLAETKGTPSITPTDIIANLF
ncbi:MAG: NAD(P)H-hydrate dehydratase [Candidatus Zophobacter franzmannii]|nr:NAD(P)H-hydrate dehydratase [Candidatus Zophobacter franzmannii]